MHSHDSLGANIITGILPNPRKPGRFAVQVDGRERATLSIEVIERLHLGIGTRVDDRIGPAIEREAAILDTYDRALNILAARARSAAELRRLLIRKGEPADQVDVAIDRLRSVGFLDDAAFARQFTRSKAVGAGVSRRRVQQELAKRGVARDVSDDAIEDVFTEEEIDESASIERVARKKLRTLAKLDPTVQRRRLYGFLARRGYDGDDIARVLRTVLTAADDEAAAERIDD
jgi:regulatory protein